MASPPTVPDSCTQPAQWTFDPDTPPPPHGFAHVAEASFDLPVSSDVLFFESRGTAALAHGSIEFTDTGDVGSDTAKVEIMAYFNDVDEFVELTKVCLLQPEEGKNGIGIFAPHHWAGHHHHRGIQYELKVHLPPAEDGSLRQLKTLNTNLPMFVHYAGALSNSFKFDKVLFTTSNVPVHVQSLWSDILNVRTSNAPIEGSFNSSTYIELDTSNSPIRANVALYNGQNVNSPVTGLQMRTSNSPIGANISLYSTLPSGTGGNFTARISTSNSPLSISYPYSPVDHRLHMHARTSNGPAHVQLHPTYEGTFRLISSGFLGRPTVHADPAVEDPAGRGRTRSVDYRSAGGRVAEGIVRWLPSDRNETELGDVQISTSQLGLDLFL
ncbi:uncharacterized protein LAESUDRAFT_658842 [Laetiporus sulphureus 93-53]|uniref:Uncharacterized protein n=1 Tax=Laetiporus sulphureus 93-53 TaxID=1314785 RepID=A0A165D0X5_9APHY|nr:uncharacterized protein LAESUDRAFT_658842 [Laetiporus sulphureus 93-53]KZT03912.1 hypothetical protein LAESUDRAFT_658842 [Laetiporus sulphureus 93-53]